MTEKKGREYSAKKEGQGRHGLRHVSKQRGLTKGGRIPGLAGLMAVLTGRGGTEVRRDLRVESDTTALVIVTEADTDPLSYARIVERSAQEVRRRQEG